MKTFGLKDKRILLTGADGFLGNHIRRVLIEEGAYVFSTDIIASLSAEQLNISDGYSVNKYVGHLIKNNIRLDGLINNAALSFKGLEITEEQFDRTNASNIKGTHNMITKCKSVMNIGASIVNISSIYGSKVPDFSIYEDDDKWYSNVSYGSSKAAIEYMTKYFAKVYGPEMRVNSVSPGGIYNNHLEDFEKKYSKRVALGRMANPEEIANSILFLLSNLSSYITGQNLSIDGGFNL